MFEINIKGDIIANELSNYYEYFDMPYTSPQNIINALQEANGEPIKVKINSGGGDVFSASEIYTELINYKAQKVVEIQGLAGSSASIIAMCAINEGDKIIISPLGQIMIHNASCGTSGDKNDLEHTKQVLDNIDETIANAYILKTGLEREKILEMMNKETWFTPQQAKEFGFVDEIINMPNDEKCPTFYNSLNKSYEIINKLKMEDVKENMDRVNILEQKIKDDKDNEIISNILIEKESRDNLFLNKKESFENRISANERALKKDVNLGDIIKGIVTGQWKSNEIKNTITSTMSGALIPQVLSSQVLDYARNYSLFMNEDINIPIVPMKSDNISISRVKRDASGFAFKREGEEGSEISLELDSVNLKAKTFYGYIYLTLEAIQSSLNLDSIVRTTLAKAVANAVDLAILYGQNGDDFAPNGIMKEEGIETITPNGVGFDDIIRARAKISQNNGVATCYAINSFTEEQLSLLKDSQGNYIEKPKSLDGIRQIVTNQLKHDNIEGTNDVLVFDEKAIVIGIMQDIQLKMIEDTECLKRGLVGIRVTMMLDAKVVQPKHICKIEGLNINNTL